MKEGHKRCLLEKYLLGGLKDASAQVKVTGKPLLTEKNLNAFIMNAYQNGDRTLYGRLAMDAKTDIRSFLQKYFTLTNVQTEVLQALSVQQMVKINQALDHIIAQRAMLTTQIVGEPRKGKEASVSIEAGSTVSSEPGSKTPVKLEGSVKAKVEY
ncbi:MAG: hypothetical protein ACUVT6_12645 [Thermodesulfobacteriota bacterium]